MSRIALALSAPVIAVSAVTLTGGWLATAAAQPISQVAAVRGVSTASVLVSSSAAASGTAARNAVTRHRHRRLSPKQVAWQMMHRFGWRARFQFRYLKWLWMRESSWNVYASNPYSGAYGIPQAAPGGKMASAGPNWRSSARTQIRWGMRYIHSRYGSPRRAWDHECAYGWY